MKKVKSRKWLMVNISAYGLAAALTFATAYGLHGCGDDGNGDNCDISCSLREGFVDASAAYIESNVVKVDGYSPTGGAFGFHFDLSTVDLNKVYFNPEMNMNEMYSISASKGRFSSFYQCSDVVIYLDPGWGVNIGDKISGTIDGKLYTQNTEYCRDYNFTFEVIAQ